MQLLSIMIGIVPLNFVFTWIFNNTGRSIFGAILFHFMVNFVGELVALSPKGDGYSVLLWFLQRSPSRASGVRGR